MRVVPVLVDGARPLRQQQLPAELRKLARLNALELSYGRYEYDAGRLLDLIWRVLATAPGTVHRSPSTANVATPVVPHTHNGGPDEKALGGAALKGPEPVRNDRARATRVLIDAERVAQSITDDSAKASALSDVAGALAATDPDRAARLIADAETIARSITGKGSKGSALYKVAEALAATDPDRAEHVARSIWDRASQAWALAHLAETLAATDPDRAEHVARSITDDNAKASAMYKVAAALAATDPDRAERIARSITDEGSKVSALVRIAKV